MTNPGIIKRFVFTAGIILLIAFALSCTTGSDDDDDSNPSGPDTSGSDTTGGDEGPATLLNETFESELSGWNLISWERVLDPDSDTTNHYLQCSYTNNQSSGGRWTASS